MARKIKSTKSTATAKTFTIVDFAKEHDRNAKSLRGKIRAMTKSGKFDFTALMVKREGKKLSHEFADNKTTRTKLAAALNIS